MSLKHNIRLLTWFNFFTDFKLYAPIAIIYFSHVAHSYALGAAILSITYISSAILDVPTGIFADKIGRKLTMILGAIFAVLYVISYAIGINFWVLSLGAIFEGLSRAFYSGNNSALLHSLLAEHELEHEYHIYSGKLSSMFQVALAVSGLLGGLIASRSFVWVMWISVIPQIVCLFISLQITDSKLMHKSEINLFLHLKQAVHAMARNINLRLLSLSSIIGFATGETIYQMQATFYNTFLPIWAVSFVKVIANIFGSLSFYFSGKLINKFGALKILLFSDIYASIIDTFSLLFPTILSPLLMSSTSLVYGSWEVAGDSLMQKEFTDEQRATMSSLNSFAGSLCFGLLTFFVGILADHIGPAKAVLLVAIGSFSLFLIHLRLFKRSHQ